jgi:hypothetical protein
MATTTTRRVRRKRAIPDLGPSVEEYCLNRSTRERATVHENRIKGQLMDILEEVGLPDGDEGEHRKLLLEAPVEFTTYKGEKGTKKTVIGIQRQQRKGSMTLNEERTMAFLQKRKLMASCTVTQVVINEDAILAANFEGAISDEDLKALYDEGKPNFAFYLITEE